MSNFLEVNSSDTIQNPNKPYWNIPPCNICATASTLRLGDKATHLQTLTQACSQGTWICKMEHCKEEDREVVTSLQSPPRPLPLSLFHPTCWCNSLISFALLWLSQRNIRTPVLIRGLSCSSHGVVSLAIEETLQTKAGILSPVNVKYKWLFCCWKFLSDMFIWLQPHLVWLDKALLARFCSCLAGESSLGPSQLYGICPLIVVNPMAILRPEFAECKISV